MENGWDGIVKGDYKKIDEKKLYFETIPVSKIIWLSILTCGIYEIVWFYKIWKTLDKKFGYKNISFLRAIFAGITSFWLFPVLNRYINKFNIKPFNAVLFAILYFVLIVSGTLSNILWLISFATFVIIAVIQGKINKVNEQNFPEAPVNKWCGINTFWSVIGGMLLCLGLFGPFIPYIDKQKHQMDPQQIQQQIEQMKEYSFKYVSLLSHAPFEKMSKETDRETYVAGNYDNATIFVEESVYTKYIKYKIDSRRLLYTFLSAITSKEDAQKAMNNAETSKIGDIEQTSCDYEVEDLKGKVKVFLKDDIYIIVSIAFDKDRTDVEPLVSKISESIKLLI